MFWRMISKSFIREFRRKLLAFAAVAFSASLVTAMLSVSLDIGDKISRELKTYGANLLMEPQMDTLPVKIGGIDYNPLAERQYIEEEELPKIKMIFWRHNIVGFAPYLEGVAGIGDTREKVALIGTWFEKELELPTGEKIITGVKQIKPWWEIHGNWVKDDDNSGDALVGIQLANSMALKPGDKIEVQVETLEGLKRRKLRVAGIVNAGGQDDQNIFVPLSYLQEIMNLKGKVSKVEVSALTTPENELARKAAKDPDSLTPEEFERWYCTAYVSAIAYQLEEAIPGTKVKAIRQVSQSEGKILKKIQLLMLVVSLAALISSALGISSLMTTNVLQRSKEIGLLKGLGAQVLAVVALFLTEAVIVGLVGGLAGYLVGLGFAQMVGYTVFGSSVPIKILVFPLVLLVAVVTALAGSLAAVRLIIRLNPAEVLHGR
ncbi:ABC transporter permease [Calderihabitans maritimus]|uniref:ABC transporter permease n=1 Tax=Calderihabitans maritimus TaxID=1246530 RepID=A0A1Z5HRP5_9FIRM|nr:ABC transporter permease [Calderihabitans maritimus]GAW91995.1 hypothetical protein KKC1_11550 [Calderihabitans maritimus]